MRMFLKTDLDEINKWRESRKVQILGDESYPPTGLIEPGVAAGFINFTQTNVALLENFVSNPEADIKKRELAIMQIVESLEKIAYDAGIPWVLAVTENPKIKEYIPICGYKPISGELFGKEIKNGNW